MLAWSIETAFSSGLFQRVIVSTEDVEIADVAHKFGAEVPFMRPATLSNDTTPTLPVIAHAIEYCEGIGWFHNFACCIYPCAPFVEVDDLVAGFSLLESSNSDFVYPVSEYAHPVQRAMFRAASGELSFIEPSYEVARTQDLKTAYHDTGQFYWAKAETWKQAKRIHSRGAGLVIPNWRAVDIDTVDDWKRAELLHEVIHAS